MNPMSEYPKQDANHPITFWTGPVGAQGTFVTGFKGRGGARASYYKVTCTCQPIAGVGQEITGYSFEEVRDRLASAAYDHAASHVLNG